MKLQLAGLMEKFEENDKMDIDPAADFLAREQSELAGIVDVHPSVSNLPGSTNTQLLDINALESSGSFEMINKIEDTAVTQIVCDQNESSFVGNQDDISQETGIQHNVPREVAEKIRKWRTEQNKRLEEKDIEEEKKKEELRDEAKVELEEWYKHHEEAIAKTKAANRNAEKQFVAENDVIEPGTEWERIAKLCDFNPKSNKSGRDVSRMRSIILQLKQIPISKS